MKSLLGKISLRKYVGLHLGEHEVTAAEVAVTPLGPIQVAARTEPCPPNELLNVIERVLNSLQGAKRRRLQVAIGLPASRVFFGTRPLRKDADPSPQAVLQKSLSSSDISIDDLTVDLMKSSVDKSPVASVAACRKKYMAAVLSVVERCGAKVIRTEPAACAFVRLASQRHRQPRRSKAMLRIFLGTDNGLAVLILGNQTIAWRPFAMPEFSESMSILSAARTLVSQNQHYGLDSSLDYVMIHGRPDLHERLQKEGLPAEMGTRMIWRADPELSDETAALGLALGCVSQNVAAFDLSRTMKPRATLREIFPWGELICECAIVVFMGLALTNYNDNFYNGYRGVQDQCDTNKILISTDVSKLEAEKKSLTEKIAALQNFINSRTAWSAYFREISASLPPSIHLTVASTDSQLAGAGGNRPGNTGKKSLSFTAIAPLTPNGAVSPDVDRFLASLRKNPRMKRAFPFVELGSIQQAAGAGGVANATFTISCQQASGKGSK